MGHPSTRLLELVTAHIGPSPLEAVLVLTGAGEGAVYGGDGPHDRQGG